MHKPYQQCRLNLHSEWETRQRRLNLKSELANWVHQILNSEWDEKLWYGCFVTFMFNYISGGFDRKCTVMEDEVERVYRTLVPHVERNPRSPSGAKRVPILIAFPDYPTQRNSGDLRDVIINDHLDSHRIEIKGPPRYAHQGPLPALRPLRRRCQKDRCSAD
jgi:hypothetical protein